MFFRGLRVVGGHVRRQQLRVQEDIRAGLHRRREVLRVEGVGGTIEVVVVDDVHLLEVLQFDHVVGGVVEEHQVGCVDFVVGGGVGVAVEVVGDLDVFGRRRLVHLHVAVTVQVVVEDVGVEVFGFF
jgi:hypothetical protein